MLMNNLSDLWYIKYQPSNMSEYVCSDENLKQKMQSWISTGELPHLGFFGPPGTGKSTAINVLINELVNAGHIDIGDVNTYNMSDEGIEAVREKITPIIQLAPFGKYRIIVLEEMEQMSPKSQGSLKRIMEDYADNARFILTSNAPHRIQDAIRSRVQAFYITKHHYELFVTKILEILIAEKVELTEQSSIQLVDKYAKATWPDFRSAINTIQQSVVDGRLMDIGESKATTGFEFQILNAIENGTIRSARQKIVESVQENQIDDFFSFLYRNVNLFSTDDIIQMKCILKIREGMVKSSMCADKELNLTATLIELDLLSKGENS